MAMWIWRCADEEQVLKFISDDKIVDGNNKGISFRGLVEAVEVENCFPAYLSEVQKIKILGHPPF
ncbi:hypothetical protein [Aeromonas rivipollensis]|uniref:hypothetical protein n=1 Tax=Aeromonas rivipollensis TaxID=948519 RepID=UPI000FA6AEE0